MIVADRFVLLHLHKSGGSFVNDLVLRHCAGARAIGYHLPHDLIPPEGRGLPVLGFVRNPWSYYVSWFAFQQQRPQPNLLYRVLSAEGSLGFAGTIGNMLELGQREELLQRLIAGLPREFGNLGLNLPGGRLAAIRGFDRGFYSFLYGYMFGDLATARIGRLENVRTQLPGLLEAAGEALSARFIDEIRAAPARNASHHTGIADYYDARLRALVERRDAALIEQFAYRFED